MENLHPRNVGKWMRKPIIAHEEKIIAKYGSGGGFWFADKCTKVDFALEAANIGFAAIAITYASGVMGPHVGGYAEAALHSFTSVLDRFPSISKPVLDAVSYVLSAFTRATGHTALAPESKPVVLFVLCTVVSKLALKIGVWVEFAQALMVNELARLSGRKDGFFIRNSFSPYMRESVREQVIDGVLFFVPLPVELLRRPWAIASKLKQARAIRVMREKFVAPKLEGSGKELTAE